MNTNKDDTDWLALLAGKTVKNADKDTRDEVDMIKKTLHYLDKEQQNPAELQRLLFRLKQEKLLITKKSLWQNPAILSALAASFIGVMISIQIFLPIPEEKDNPFSIKAFILPQVIKHPNPPEQAETLLKQLKRLNLNTRVTSEKNQVTLEIQLTQKTDEIKQILANFGIIMPKGQQLRIEIIKE